MLYIHSKTRNVTAVMVKASYVWCHWRTGHVIEEGFQEVHEIATPESSVLVASIMWSVASKMQLVVTLYHSNLLYTLNSC